MECHLSPCHLYYHLGQVIQMVCGCKKHHHPRHVVCSNSGSCQGHKPLFCFSQSWTKLLYQLIQRYWWPQKHVQVLCVASKPFTTYKAWHIGVEVKECYWLIPQVYWQLLAKLLIVPWIDQCGGIDSSKFCQHLNQGFPFTQSWCCLAPEANMEVVLLKEHQA